MAKYRKKPVVIEAEQWAPYKVSDFLSQANLAPIDSDADWRCQGCGNRATLHMNCPTLEGWHIVCPGDYIIKGIKGEFYPCKPDIFEMTYEKWVKEYNGLLKEKEIITEEMGVHKDWYKQAKEMRLEDLPNFINRLLDDYEHDYGTICHALTAGAIATLYAMNNHEQGGITGFQAGCIMWEFIKNWNYTDNKTSLKITDFDKMLYPQYANSFEKTLSSTTWEALRKEAEVLLEENKGASPIVIEHWKSIVNGNIPFGYKLENRE